MLLAIETRERSKLKPRSILDRAQTKRLVVRKDASSSASWRGWSRPTTWLLTVRPKKIHESDIATYTMARAVAPGRSKMKIHTEPQGHAQEEEEVKDSIEEDEKDMNSDADSGGDSDTSDESRDTDDELNTQDGGRSRKTMSKLIINL